MSAQILSIAAHHVQRLEARDAELGELIRTLRPGSRDRREMLKMQRETRQMRDFYAGEAAKRPGPADVG
jgi:hypothetical protein